MTTGELLVSLSGLSGVTALAHLMAVISGAGPGAVAPSSWATVRLIEQTQCAMQDGGSDLMATSRQFESSLHVTWKSEEETGEMSEPIRLFAVVESLSCRLMLREDRILVSLCDSSHVAQAREPAVHIEAMI